MLRGEFYISKNFSKLKMQKKFFRLTGVVHLIGELVHINRKNGLPDLFKKVLTIETPDGQVLYPEVRNNKIKMLDRENIQEKDNIELEFSFEGSEKNGKRYNNIYTNSIKKI